MLDQVVVRPEALDRFDESAVRVLTAVGGGSLVGPDGSPDSAAASDHLPLVFAWNL